MKPYSAKHALLSNTIDYAGTFPPAALTLEMALKKAASLRATTAHPWLMGRATAKWSDIKTLTPSKLFDSGANGVPWIFTALGTDSSAEEWERQLEWDLREVRAFNARYTGTSLKIWVVALETKVPTVSTNELGVRIPSCLDRFLEATNGDMDLYLEVAMGDGFVERVTGAIEAVGKWLEENSVRRWVPGLKFRTGGALVPSAADLAMAIGQTTYARLKFKATQGLHHPITHGKEFGFVNLFAALGFAQALGSDRFPIAKIEQCLKDENPANFSLTERLRWNDLELSVEEIETARRYHCGTFGSCSVEEPDQFLSEVYPD